MMRERLRLLLEQAAKSLEMAFPAGVLIEQPPQGVSADLATNVAMQLVRQEGRAPRELAALFAGRLAEHESIARVEIAGPGFLNIFLEDSWFADALSALNPAAPLSLEGEPQKVLVEFISANPTGPLHIGNARGGPMGESIARSLEKTGVQVAREFYVNDIGGQAMQFAASVLHVYLKHFGIDTPFPEKGYPEFLVRGVADRLAAEEGDRFAKLPEDQRAEALRPQAILFMVETIRSVTDQMGISFDRWYSQSSLVEGGLSAQALESLVGSDATMEKDGAIWLKSGVAEDDRETVLVKSNGITTYFLDDIAYHYDKLVTRGFDQAVVVLGANHSGHIPRMRAAIQAMGLDPHRYRGVIYQQVQLKQGGENVKMSKREGNFVTAEEVLGLVPRDVFTYFLLSKASESHIDFDLQLATDTSEKNPVYYIQYAHARIRSVLRLAEEKQVVPSQLPGHAFSPMERQLIFWLDEYPDMVREVARTYRTNLLATYAFELAVRFHHFYAHQRILDEDPGSATRLLLSKLAADTLKDVLGLMNIEAMERM